MEYRNTEAIPTTVNSKKEFDYFYRTHYQRFVKYAIFYVEHLETAEDITHDVLLSYWENKESIPAERDVLSYIVTSIKNRCLNHLKHLKVELEYSKKQAAMYDWEIDIRIDTLEYAGYSDIFLREVMEIINNSLSEMHEQTKNIFILNHFQGKSRKEIASILHVSQQKVDYHINKAQKHLFKNLKDFLPIIIYLTYLH